MRQVVLPKQAILQALKLNMLVVVAAEQGMSPLVLVVAAVLAMVVQQAERQLMQQTALVQAVVVQVVFHLVVMAARVVMV